jgi:hypothetical protein
MCVVMCVVHTFSRCVGGTWAEFGSPGPHICTKWRHFHGPPQHTRALMRALFSKSAAESCSQCTCVCMNGVQPCCTHADRPRSDLRLKRVDLPAHHLCLDRRAQHTPKSTHTLEHMWESCAQQARAPHIASIQAGRPAARLVVRRHFQPTKSCTPEVSLESAFPSNTLVFDGEALGGSERSSHARSGVWGIETTCGLARQGSRLEKPAWYRRVNTRFGLL